MPGPERRHASARALALAALGVAVGALAWWPMLVTDRGPTSDGRYVHYQFEIAKAAIRHFGEVPLFNPYDCKGIPMWDHPESMVLSPFFVLLLPLATPHAILVWSLLHLAIGFSGAFVLMTRELGTSRLGALVASTLYVAYAGAAAQYAGLHATLMGFYYLPWLLFGWRRAERDPLAAVLLGALVALMFYDGSTYPLPFTALVLLAETTTRLWPPARLFAVLRAAAITLVVAVGLAAARLLPVADRLGRHARDIPQDVDQLLHSRTLWRMLTWRKAEGFTSVPDQQYWWHEYVVYLGVAGVVVAAIGAPFVLRRGRRWVLAPALFAFALMLGNVAPSAPWPFLRAHVFPFHALRVPSRFRHVLVLFVCAFVAFAIDQAPSWLARLRPALARIERPVRALVLALAAYAIVDTALLSHEIVTLRYQGDLPVAVTPSPRFYYGGEGLTPDWMNQPGQNRAWLGCRTYFPSHEGAALWEGDVPQARAASDDVTVLSTSRTNNTLTAVVEARAPGRILFNTAYDRDWRPSVGERRFDHDVLAVDVPAGSHTVVVRYWPRLLTLGLSITAATALGLVIWLIRRYRGRYGWA